MKTVRLIVYTPVHAEIDAFVVFWAARYRGYDDAFYASNIGRELTEARILDWFTWKNGTPLSDLKRRSVLKNFVARRHELSELSANETAAGFLDRFSEGGAIWRIFWLHCCRPEFPIYDQHVHRAMQFIQFGRVEEIPNSDREKIAIYLTVYLPFYARFSKLDSRQVDKALWAFGKFVGENDFPTEPRCPS